MYVLRVQVQLGINHLVWVYIRIFETRLKHRYIWFFDSSPHIRGIQIWDDLGILKLWQTNFFRSCWWKGLRRICSKGVPSLKLTFSLKIGHSKRKFMVQTTNFQVRTVSFRERIPTLRSVRSVRSPVTSLPQHPKRSKPKNEKNSNITFPILLFFAFWVGWLFL